MTETPERYGTIPPSPPMVGQTVFLRTGERIRIIGPGGREILRIVAGNPWDDSETTTIARFNQRDPRWADVPLGHSDHYTIGSAGCALCCAAMVATLVEPSISPLTLQERLLPAGGFWRANLDWAKVPGVVSGLEFEGITNWENTRADVDAVYTQLNRGPLILWVDFSPGGAQQTHFVLATRRAGDDLRIIDPWCGDEVGLLERYGAVGWTLERAIYGMRPLHVIDPAVTSLAAQQIVSSTAFDDYPERRP